MSEEVLLIRRTPSTTVAIPITTLQDVRLSYRARGVLAMLLTYENETLISTADLPKHGVEGRDALRHALAELRALDYVQQTRYSYVDPAGRSLWGWETVVNDTPLPKPENPSSVPENPSSVIDQKRLVTTPATRQQKQGDTPYLPTITEDGFSGFLTTSTNNDSQYEQNRFCTSYKTAPVTDGARPKVQGGWDLVAEGHTPKKSQRQQRLEALAEAKATDPAEVFTQDEIDSQPHPEPETTGYQELLDASRQEVARKRSTRPLSAPQNLSRYFETSALPADADEAPGRFSSVALSRNFATWMREGTSTAQIRVMIETYWSGAFRRNTAVPAWQDFLRQRAQISGQGKTENLLAAMEDHRHDADYWG